jgi:hypothetical protein
MTNGTLKELTTAEIARIIYNSWLVFHKTVDAVTPWEPYDSLPEPLKALEVAQVEAIINKMRLRPHELHENLVVTVQNIVAEGQLDEKISFRLAPYMIPFSGLGIELKTRFRLQVQLARILLRHNRNVKRQAKRQG